MLAQKLSADLLVQFTKAADAANRAVMADTDEASVAFAGEAGAGEAGGPEGRRRAEAGPQGPRLLGGSTSARGVRQPVLRVSRAGPHHPRPRRREHQPQGAAALLRSCSGCGGLLPGSRRGRRAHGRGEGLLARQGAGRHGRVDGAGDPGAAGPAHRRRGRCGDDAHREADGDIRGGCAASARDARASRPARVPTAACRRRRPHWTASWASTPRSSPSPGATPTCGRSRCRWTRKGKLTGACEESLHALRDALAQRGFTGTR